MASVAALNVRIGGDIKQLEKALKDAERAVKKSGAQLSAIGNDLSLKLSLPMAAFGAASLKAAGDIEALNKSMIATFAGSGRSIEEARMEVDALRKSAEAPGLDFEQAVKASIRLQGVGQSAEKARTTVEQLANAVATTGGTAEDLGEVVNQFSQMIGKNKILNEDIKIITGRMPILAGLMKEAFGSTQAEDIRKTGKTAQEFVDTLVAGMAKLPRVEGGISNAIVNAGTSIKMFLASVGESLNKTFNITGKLESFAKFLDGLAQGFANMSDGTRTALAGVAVFVLALGPMIKVGQFAILTYGAFTKAMTFFAVSALRAEAAAKGVTLAAIAMDRATKLTVIGAAIGVVLALAAAFLVLRTDMSATAQANRAVEEINKKAAESILFQKESVDVLVRAYKDEKTSLEGKKNILNQLNQISPEYFGGIQAGKNDIEAITLAQGKYNAELLRTARVTAAKERLVEIESELLKIDEKRGTLSGGERFALGLTGINNTTDALKKQKGVLDEQAAPLLKQREFLSKIATENAVVEANTKKTTDAVKANTASANDNATAVDKQAKAYRELDKAQRVAERQADEAAAKRARAQGNFAPLPTLDTPGVSQENPDTVQTQNIATDPTFAQTKILAAAKSLANMNVVLGAFKEGVASFSEVWNAMSENMHLSIEGLSLSLENLGKVLKVAMVDATAAAQDYADKGGASFKEMGNEALAGAAKVVRAYIMQGVAATVSKALTSLPFGLGLIAGGIAGAAAGTLFNKLLNSLKIPAMAMGGTAKGGLTLVGELGPELVNLPRGAQVTPNNKLSSMMGGGSPAIVLTPSIHYDATGFRIMLEKEQKRYGRVNG